MNCPHCGYSDSKVTDSRVVENGIRRRRECQQCSDRFTTYERIQTSTLTVTKEDDRREDFDRDKLLSGIRKACAKRPVSSRIVEKLVEDIEVELQRVGQTEVTSKRLGILVMDRLKEIDRVAYIRFASVYRDFQDIDSFEEAVKDLKEESTQLPLLEDTPPAPMPRRRRGRPVGPSGQRGNGKTAADITVQRLSGGNVAPELALDSGPIVSQRETAGESLDG